MKLHDLEVEITDIKVLEQVDSDHLIEFLELHGGKVHREHGLNWTEIYLHPYFAMLPISREEQASFSNYGNSVRWTIQILSIVTKKTQLSILKDLLPEFFEDDGLQYQPISTLPMNKEVQAWYPKRSEWRTCLCETQSEIELAHRTFSHWLELPIPCGFERVNGSQALPTALEGNAND